MSVLIIKIEGGLGNQLLQYLFGQSLSRLHNKDVFFDISEYIEGRGIRRFALTELGLPGKFISCKKNLSSDHNLIYLRKIKSHGQALKLSDWFSLRKKIPLLVERDSGTLQDFALIQSAYFSGYWVSFNYWHQPCELVAWVNDYLDRTAIARGTIVGALLPHVNDSCAIHVRRGDYLNPEHLAWHGVCAVEYFNQPLTISRAKHHIYFSDDQSFIDDQFSKNPGYVNASRLIGNEIDEFLILRNYRAMVISNSTYSYLAALFSSFRFPNARIMTPYPWYQWGNSQPPLLPAWHRLNAVTGVDEAVDLKAASQLTLNVLLCGFTERIALTNALKMLQCQARRPNQITVQLNPSFDSELAIGNFIRQAFEIEPSFIQEDNQNAFLCQVLDRTRTDFVVVLSPDTWWHPDKLAVDLRLAAEVQADVIVSRIGFSEWLDPALTSLNVNASVKNSSALIDRSVTSLLSGLGTALIKTNAFNQLGRESLMYELALANPIFFVQDEIMAQYSASRLAVNYLEQRLEYLSKIRLLLQTDCRASDELKLSVLTLFVSLKTLIEKSQDFDT